MLMQISLFILLFNLLVATFGIIIYWIRLIHCDLARVSLSSASKIDNLISVYSEWLCFFSSPQNRLPLGIGLLNSKPSLHSTIHQIEVSWVLQTSVTYTYSYQLSLLLLFYHSKTCYDAHKNPSEGLLIAILLSVMLDQSLGESEHK